MSRNTQIFLVVGGCYVLGFIGIFISTLMKIWNIGPAMYVFGEAAWRSLLWPYEIVRLLTGG
jgi:hypothetical protein